MDIVQKRQDRYHFFDSFSFMHSKMFLQVGFDGKLATAERTHERLGSFMKNLKKINILYFHMTRFGLRQNRSAEKRPPVYIQ